MSKLSPFLEGMLSAVILLPSAVSAKPKYIEPSNADIHTINELTTHEPFIQVGLTMKQVANEKRFLGQANEQ